MCLEKPTSQELEFWEKKLAEEGLSLHEGNTNHHLVYVVDTDIYQTKKVRTGDTGGRLTKYKLGEKRSLTLSCKRCGRSFVARRQDAKWCSWACNKANQRMSQITGLEDGDRK